MPQYTNVSVRQPAAKVASSGGSQLSLDDLSIIEPTHRSRQEDPNWSCSSSLTDSVFLSLKRLQRADRRWRPPPGRLLGSGNGTPDERMKPLESGFWTGLQTAKQPDPT